MVSLEKRIFLIAGSGGVGKTTLSASLAVRLAEKGHDTIVLTVDPAKRLGQALGLESMEKEVVEVPISAKGKLWASSLQSTHYLDGLIHRIARTAEQEKKILANPLYRAMSTTLAGTHEYAAMERILEFAGERRFSKIIVDTPPTENAVDLLTAPRRMIDFMSITGWFSGRSSFLTSLFHRGTVIVLAALRRILGTDFFDSFESLMKDIEGLQSGFQERNRRVMELLRSPECSFLLATVANEGRYLEARQFCEMLSREQIPLRAILINQLTPKPPVLSNPAGALKDWHAFENAHFEKEQRAVKDFASFRVPTIQIAKRGDAPSTLADLSKLGSSWIE